MESSSLVANLLGIFGRSLAIKMWPGSDWPPPEAGNRCPTCSEPHVHLSLLAGSHLYGHYTVSSANSYFLAQIPINNFSFGRLQDFFTFCIPDKTDLLSTVLGFGGTPWEFVIVLYYIRSSFA